VTLQGYEILVIDDDADFLNLVKLILQAAGARVSTVTSIKAAVTHLQKSIPHLILLDLNLPEIGGYTFLEARKKIDAIHSVPLLVVSARNDRTSVTQAIQMGASDYLTKPITRFSLTQRVEKVLKIYHDQPLSYAFDEPVAATITLPATLIRLSQVAATVECAAKLTGNTPIELKAKILEQEGIEKTICKVNEKPSHIIEENLFTSTVHFFGLGAESVKKIQELLRLWR